MLRISRPVELLAHLLAVRLMVLSEILTGSAGKEVSRKRLSSLRPLGSNSTVQVLAVLKCSMANSQLYRGVRHPREAISRVAWPHFRFSLTFRDIQEPMAGRDIVVTYETIRANRPVSANFLIGSIT